MANKHNSKNTTALARPLLIAFAMSSWAVAGTAIAQTGAIHLYEDPGCQKGLATLTVAARGRVVDVRTGEHDDHKYGGNDKISSVRFVNVPVGTVLELWDHGETRQKDDWCRITVLQKGTFQVNHIEHSPGTAGLKYERFGKRDSTSDPGNLKGKVSHLVLRPGAGTTTPAPKPQNFVYYSVSVRTSNFDGTTNDCYIRLYGEAGATSSWHKLEGKHRRGDSYPSPVKIGLPFIGKVEKIDLRVQKKSAFQSSDAWTPEFVIVQSPKNDTTDRDDPNGYHETKFAVNRKISEGYKELAHFTKQTSMTAPLVTKVGERSDVVVVNTVLGHLNNTNESDSGQQLAESWTQSVTKGVASSKETGFGVEASLGFETGFGSTTVSGSLTASMQQAWSEEKSTQTTSETSSGLDYSFNVPPNSIVFSKTRVKVPVKYTERSSGKHPGERIFTRTQSARITSSNVLISVTTQLPLPTADATSIRPRMSYQEFMTDYFKYLHPEDRQLVENYMPFWRTSGALSGVPTELKAATRTTPEPRHQPKTESDDIDTKWLGRYEYRPVENDWHVGTITRGPGHTLKWTNRANVSWKLSFDGRHKVMGTGSDNPYHNEDYDGGKIRDFKLKFDEKGQPSGFQFGPMFYHRIGN